MCLLTPLLLLIAGPDADSNGKDCDDLRDGIRLPIRQDDLSKSKSKVAMRGSEWRGYPIETMDG